MIRAPFTAAPAFGNRRTHCRTVERQPDFVFGIAAIMQPAEQEWHAAEETIDAIRTRFGSSAIGPASAVEADGLRLVRRGSQQWGPEHDAT